MKKFIVDGHNLIPKIPGLSLSQPDDETRLLELLGEYARRTRVRFEVFFDGAPPTQAGQIKGGLMHVHFIRQSTIADEAIIRYLHAHQNERDGITLVTSDQRILSEARSLRIAQMKSEDFSRELRAVISSPSRDQNPTSHAISPEEVEDWIQIFSQKKK